MKRVITLTALWLTTFAMMAQKYEVDTVKYCGSTKGFINLVFLGDGYTKDEMATFEADVKEQAEALFQIVPWKNYRNYINVFLIKTPSNVSGAGLTENAPVDNFYGTTFGYGGTDRLLYTKYPSRVTNVLRNNFPNYDLAAMIVNSTKYGGAGGSFLTFSKYKNPANPSYDSSQIFYHESGHTFAGLADEYWAGASYAQEKPNLTKTSSKTTVKWKNWVDIENVGVYVHSETERSGTKWYRPHQNCLMRYLGVPYCAVCRQELVENIHAKIGVLQGYQPSTTSGLTIGDAPTTFSLSLTKPEPNTLRTLWQLDGTEIARNQDAIDVQAGMLTDGKHTLTVAIEDTTQMLRVDNHARLHATNVIWQIEKDPLSGISTVSTTSRYTVYPVPFGAQLTVEKAERLASAARIELYNAAGKRVISGKTDGSGRCSLRTESLQPGTYILRIVEGGVPVYTRKLLKR